MVAEGTAVVSQRQWQRDRTVTAIERAALHVFVERGYDETTADHIAKATGVSVRTFFRYFPRGKEDVMLLEVRRNVDRLEQALNARPADEPVVTAIRRALSSLLDDGQELGSSEAAHLYGEVARDHRDLLATMMGERQMCLERLVPALADRMCLDPAHDVRPRLLAHLLHAAMSAAWLNWLDGIGSNATTLLQDALERLEPLFDIAPDET